MPDLTPTARAVAEILWRHHTLAHTRVDDFADEAAEILTAVEAHRHDGEGGRAGTPVEAVFSPTGAPGARCPSRIAHESGAVLRCQRQEHPLALAHMSADRRVFWTPLDDRVIDSYGPATSPTGGPNDAA